MTHIYIAAVLSPDSRDIAVMVTGSYEGMLESLRDNYDQGGVYEEDGDIVADLQGDGYLVTIDEGEVN